MPTILLSNPLGSDDAERIGLPDVREYAVGELITVDDFVAFTLIRTGYGTAVGTVTDILIVGTGTPPGTIGADGQWYLDTYSEVLWGPKVSGSWPTDPIRPDRGVAHLAIDGNGHLQVTYSTGTVVDLGNIIGPAGPGVPAGGATGGVLVKNSATNQDTGWSTPTSAATASTLAKRDAAGRLQIADPSAAADAASKNYVDTTAGDTQGSNSTLARRDASGVLTGQQVTIGQAAPTSAAHAARKDYVDTQGTATLNSARRRAVATTAAAAYTLALTDEGKVVYNTSAALTVTVPLNSAVAFPVGSWVDVVAGSAAATTIVPAAGVTLIGPDGQSGGTFTVRSPYSTVRLYKYGGDSWFVTGDAASSVSQAVAAAASAGTASTLVKRDSFANAAFNEVMVSGQTTTASATRKDYVDAGDALAVPRTQKGAASGVPALDATSGLLVPAYAEVTELSAPPATPAAGRSRWYINTNHRIVTVDSTGQFRTTPTYLGSGTAFPTTLLVIGDHYLRTDLGVLCAYQGGTVGLSGWLPLGGPVPGGVGPLLARVERLSSAGPVVGNTLVDFSSAASGIGSPTFTLAAQTRVQVQVRGKLNCNTSGGDARVNLYLTPGSTPGTTLANQAGLFDMVIVNSALGQTFTYECDTVLAAGTWTMSMGLQAPLNGQNVTLVYESSAGGREAFSSTVLKALALGVA